MSETDSGQAEIVETLRACQQDQARVHIYFNGATIGGLVARLDPSTVEIREQSQRVVVRLDRIDAVRRD